MEGMEELVLRGAASTIREQHPLLYVENNVDDARSPALVRYLYEIGYRCYWHAVRAFAPTNNYYHNDVVLSDTIMLSVNMLCHHLSHQYELVGFEPVTVPLPEQDEQWISDNHVTKRRVV